LYGQGKGRESKGKTEGERREGKKREREGRGKEGTVGKERSLARFHNYFVQGPEFLFIQRTKAPGGLIINPLFTL